ncbi:MAG: M55 family metallopeptidase [Candidatus Cloacimonetes bacterium]|nr:M55 family metallopeptidase [Candidatus Cloacimonadota bacterium]
MKIYVICKMEGIGGIIDFNRQCLPAGSYYEQARKLATLELNALVNGVLEAGATEVHVWDGQGSFPGCLDYDLVHTEAEVITGTGESGPVGLDSSYNALFQLGLHARAGTPGAVLAHSFTSRIKECTVNGIPVGDIWMNCYLAGSLGIPCVFLSGDRAAVLEAEALIPEIETVEVKKSLSKNAVDLSLCPVRSLSAVKSRQLIYKKARQAMKKIGVVKPFQAEPPFKLRTVFQDHDTAQRAASRNGILLSDEFTVETISDNFPRLITG